MSSNKVKYRFCTKSYFISCLFFQDLLLYGITEPYIKRLECRSHLRSSHRRHVCI